MGDGSVSCAQLDRWAKLYGTQHRQLRRWIARGREKQDACPLDDPAALLQWIDRNIERIRGDLRERVTSVAAKLQVSPEKLQPSAENPGEIAPPAVDPPTTAPSPVVTPFDLSSVGGVEGESVAFYRQLFAATKQLLAEAYTDGVETRIATLHKRLDTVGEALRKHEISAEAKAKKRGELLDRGEVIHEVSQALNALKLLHENMVMRILAALPGLDPELANRLRGAVETELAREDDVLRNIGTYKSLDDLQLSLVA